MYVGLYGFERQRIAVFTITPYGTSESIARAFMLELSSRLTQSKRIVNIEREQIEKVFEEQKMSLSGCTSTECVIKMGQLLNAQKILVGSITKTENYYLISVRIVDVVMGAIEYETKPVRAKNEDEFGKAAEKIVQEIEARVEVRPEIVGFVGENPVIDVGSDFGLKVGDELDVIRFTGVVRDKEGRVIFRNEEVIGKVRILQVQSMGAVCEIIDQKKEIREGDFCRTIKVGAPTQPVQPTQPQPPVADNVPPQIIHEPYKTAPEGASLRISATITDNVGVKEAFLYYKNREMKGFARVPMQQEAEKLFVGIIKPERVKKPRLEYFIEAYDEAGNVARFASKDAPHVIIVRMGAKPVAEKPKKKKGPNWLVIGGGTVLVGGAVTGAILLMGGGGGKLPPMPNPPE